MPDVVFSFACCFPYSMGSSDKSYAYIYSNALWVMGQFPDLICDTRTSLDIYMRSKRLELLHIPNIVVMQGKKKFWRGSF